MIERTLEASQINTSARVESEENEEGTEHD